MHPNCDAVNAILQDPASRALYLFPTKALAQDQLAELHARLRELGFAEIRPSHGCVFGNIQPDGSRLTELAEVLGKPTADAARKAARRALLRLAEEMKTL